MPGMQRRTSLLIALLAALAVPLLAQTEQQWGAWTPGPGAYGDPHWRPPVADEESLPLTGNALGDTRVARAESTIHLWTGSAWEAIGSAGSAFWLDPDSSCLPGAIWLSTTTNRLRIGSGSCTTSDLLGYGLGLTGTGTALVAVNQFEGEDRVEISADRTIISGHGNFYTGTWRVDSGASLSPLNGGTITATSASTATALAANGTNCASGEAARGVDASGNAEGCFAAGGSVGFADVGTGTNANALVVGSGGSLAATGTGTIAATSAAESSRIDSGLNGASPELSVSSSQLRLDPNADGTVDLVVGRTADAAYVGAATAAGRGAILFGDDNRTYVCRDNGTSAPSACPITIKPYSFADFGGASIVTTAYLDVGGCRIYGALASPPSAPMACWQYYDTSGAQCLYTTEWVELGGAGTCDSD